MSIEYSYDQYILAVTLNNEDITLRIDRDSWMQSQIEGAPVVELKLIACDDVASMFEKLNASTGKPVYYEVIENNDQVAVALSLNYYEPDDFQINCKQISETLMDYTFEDLKTKTKRLAESYTACLTANQLGDYIYHLLKDTLSKMIQKELDLSQRKIEFFARTNPEKAAILTGEEQAYRKVLTRMGLGEINGKVIAPQIRDAILEIWSENVWHQATYAALVESRIADMGESALFPLLEIIKQPNSWYMRDEAILILGMIDPEVKEKVMKIVQLDNNHDRRGMDSKG